ncbi:MAG: hypothetical protein IPM16_06645 [Chloroflexi bacterium]|nr:hypothetical protein [Chloroflexota bacterium]
MNTLQPFHLAALHAAHALMLAAAEVGKPYACWANHRAVGGARTADQLVDLGLFEKRLGATPGDVDTYFYRITGYGCLCIGRPYPLEDLPMTEQTTVRELRFFDLPDTSDPPQPTQPVSPSLRERGPGGEVSEEEGLGVRASDSSVIAELRADRDALIEQIIALEARVKAAEAERDAAIAKPAEDTRADFEKRISSLSDMYMNEAAKVVELKTSHALALKAAEDAQAERDALKREHRALEQQIATVHGTDAQVECDFVFDITPHDLRSRWLAGWKVEHYALDGSSVNVILRRDRKPGRKGKRAPRAAQQPVPARAPHAPAPSIPTRAPSAAVLTGGEVNSPLPEGEGLGVRAHVVPDLLATFKRNLADQFAANPVAPMRAIHDLTGSQPV